LKAKDDAEVDRASVYAVNDSVFSPFVNPCSV